MPRKVKLVILAANLFAAAAVLYATYFTLALQSQDGLDSYKLEVLRVATVLPAAFLVTGIVMHISVDDARKLNRFDGEK